MKMLLARSFLFFFLICGVAGAPAYEIYANTAPSALENIVAEWEEAALGESSSKRLRARRDMHRSPAGPPLEYASVRSRSAPLLAAPPWLARILAFCLNLHHALQVFRI